LCTEIQPDYFAIHLVLDAAPLGAPEHRTQPAAALPVSCDDDTTEI
jgi:hypothetical protein